ncbi:MAG TPA: hypothetical protein VEI02_01920 [Planctomycetota bacterium]|nr:hypothetical protein [Planctomycetota bacterium]
MSTVAAKPTKRLPLARVRTSSSLCSVAKKELCGVVVDPARTPEVGDVALCRVVRLGQHHSIEHGSGRIHMAFDGTQFLGAFGNRYAPDYFEALVPTSGVTKCDLIARSGLLGKVKGKNSAIIDPTRVEVVGFATDRDGRIVNTRNFPAITEEPNPADLAKVKLVLVVGASMNAGKSTAAKACVYSLAARGEKVAAGKATGTASLKDILLMEDAGAEVVSDFTALGYPTTYLVSREEAETIFRRLFGHLAHVAKGGYVVMEVADGILQRETRMILESPFVRRHIHRLVLCCGDPLAVAGGIQILDRDLGLKTHAISGRVASSDLGRREVATFTKLPCFDAMEVDTAYLHHLLR